MGLELARRGKRLDRVYNFGGKRGDCGTDILDHFLLDAKLAKCSDEMRGDPVEMALCDGEPGVSPGHRCAAILTRSAEGLRQERELMSAQPAQVHRVKERRKFGIGEDAAIEDLYCCVDGGLSAQALV